MTTSSSTEQIDLAAEGSTALLTRDQGAKLLAVILRSLEDRDSIRLDLTNVRALSPSFADELFGTLNSHLGPAQFRRRVALVCPSPAWKSLISKVLAHRRAKAARP